MKLELAEVSVRVGGRPVLRNVSLTVSTGELVGIVGPNGAGKTTLLRAALGLAKAEAGVVRLGGRPIAGLSARSLAEQAAYLPQERRVAWGLPARRVAELGAPFATPAEAASRALKALNRVGLGGLQDRSVLDMSGGERAKALLARMLVTQAPLYLVDEPAAGLDPEAQLAMLDVLAEETGRGAAVVLTLHDLTLAVRACDRLIVLDQGRIVADDTPARALTADVLLTVFGLDGAVRDTPEGPVVSARRRRLA